MSEQKIDIFFSSLIFLLTLLVQISLSSHAQASLNPFQASPDQVLVLYNADWQKDVDGSELGLAADIPLVGVVGRLDPIKDHPTLFRAFEAVRTVLPEARLLVVGDGPERKRLKNQAGVGVIFLGNRSDAPEILRALDLFVQPSLNEGISNTILEAMACGLPVVAIRVGGNPELVNDGVSGMLIPQGDPGILAHVLIKYMIDNSLRKQHGTSGRKRVVEYFSVARMVREYEKVWARVCGES